MLKLGRKKKHLPCLSNALWSCLPDVVHEDSAHDLRLQGEAPLRVCMCLCTDSGLFHCLCFSVDFGFPAEEGRGAQTSDRQVGVHVWGAADRTACGYQGRLLTLYEARRLRWGFKRNYKFIPSSARTWHHLGRCCRDWSLLLAALCERAQIWRGPREGRAIHLWPWAAEDEHLRLWLRYTSYSASCNPRKNLEILERLRLLLFGSVCLLSRMVVLFSSVMNRWKVFLLLLLHPNVISELVMWPRAPCPETCKCKKTKKKGVHDTFALYLYMDTSINHLMSVKTF